MNVKYCAVINNSSTIIIVSYTISSSITCVNNCSIINKYAIIIKYSLTINSKNSAIIVSYSTIIMNYTICLTKYISIIKTRPLLVKIPPESAIAITPVEAILITPLLIVMLSLIPKSNVLRIVPFKLIVPSFVNVKLLV